MFPKYASFVKLTCVLSSPFLASVARFSVDVVNHYVAAIFEHCSKKGSTRHVVMAAALSITGWFVDLCEGAATSILWRMVGKQFWTGTVGGHNVFHLFSRGFLVFGRVSLSYGIHIVLFIR